MIDSHAHLTHDTLYNDIEAIIERASSLGIKTIVNICTNPEEVEKGLLLQKRFPQIHCVAATTPHDIAAEGELVFEQMANYAKSGALIAVGETGLDYHYFPESKTIQQEFLRKYLNLAKECELPVVIHCRDAFADFFEIIDQEYAGKPGVLHCFTGTLSDAEELVKRGWYVSFSGIVTFNKSIELQKVAQSIPLSHLLIETDAPYLAPAPHRGKSNEPSYLAHTAAFVAKLRGISCEELVAATSTNANTLFRLFGN